MTQASEKQLAFIAKLLKEKDINTSTHAVYLVAVNTLITSHPDQLTKVNASKAIDMLMAIKTSTPAHAKTYTKVEAGFYFYKNEVYKVVVSPQTDNTYAKVFTEEGGWLYATGAVKLLVNAPALTLDQAKEYGKLYGTCIICSRTLTDETSIEQGIGPVCAAKF